MKINGNGDSENNELWHDGRQKEIENKRKLRQMEGE